MLIRQASTLVAKCGGDACARLVRVGFVFVLRVQLVCCHWCERSQNSRVVAGKTIRREGRASPCVSSKVESAAQAATQEMAKCNTEQQSDLHGTARNGLVRYLRKKATA